MADCYDDEPTPEERIQANKREMERIQAARELQTQGYGVTRDKQADDERLITLHLANKRLQAEKDKAQNEYWAAHDL
jgi:hypothetical protein